MKLYDPTNWYWRIAGDQTRAFSSAVGDYVPNTDATFVDWLSDGSVASTVATEADLGAALSASLARPTNAAVLDAYLTTQAHEIARGPAFKPVFYLMQQVAALNGDPHPTVDEAIAYTKSVL